MSKVLVIYSSKYGSTKKYADWIKEELNGDFFEVDKIKLIKNVYPIMMSYY